MRPGIDYARSRKVFNFALVQYLVDPEFQKYRIQFENPWDLKVIAANSPPETACATAE